MFSHSSGDIILRPAVTTVRLWDWSRTYTNSPRSANVALTTPRGLAGLSLREHARTTPRSQLRATG